MRARSTAVLQALAAHPRAIYAATKRTLRHGALDLSDEDRRAFRERIVPRWCLPEAKARMLAAVRPRR